MEDFRKGILLALVLSFSVLLIFYGDLLKDPNKVYFSASGDGLKSYVGAMYHLENDSSYLRSGLMNYPYGEMVFFTDSQPFIVNQVKFLKNLGIDFSQNIVAIFNLFMLFSLVLATVFICLIFIELKVSWWFAAIAAIGISMLSPQIGRMGGHFSLSHLMWLPMLIWLLIRFDRFKSIRISVLIGILTFLAAGMHMYFFALFGFLFLFYWAYALFTNEFEIRSYKWVLHLFIQLILPLILVQLIAGASDTISDRTTHPWGFTTYRANPASVLLPLHKPYAAFLMKIEHFRTFDWEAFAFIGLVAFFGFLFGLAQMVIRIKHKQAWWQVSDNRLVTIFFWASVASLLLSFSVPFNLGLMFLLDYLGPIQQLRALARFSWVFYYMINILVFYGIFKFLKKGIYYKATAFLALSFLLYDGYLNVSQYAPRLNNRIAELEDTRNDSPENAWVSFVNGADYQAVLPIPYFHIGSENVWLEPKNDMLKQSFIVSLKSGLPSMGVMLSRTSLSQTYKSLAIACDPVSDYLILNDLPNTKPLLLLVDTTASLNQAEKRILQHSGLLWNGPKFSLYTLPVDTLKQLAHEGKIRYKEELASLEADSLIPEILYLNRFEDLPNNTTFSGIGAFSAGIQNWNRIVDVELQKGLPGEQVELMFWVYGYETDLMARSIIEFVQKNGEETVDYKYTQFQHHYNSLHNGWMRIRIPFVLKSENDKVMVSVRNPDLKNFKLIIDDVIIRKQAL